MALEAAVFQQDWFGHNSKELYNLAGGNWSYDFGLDQNEEDQDKSCSSYFLENQTETFLHGDWNPLSPPVSMAPPFNDLLLTCSNIPSLSDASIDAANGLMSTTPTSDHHHRLGESSEMAAPRVKRRSSEISNALSPTFKGVIRLQLLEALLILSRSLNRSYKFSVPYSTSSIHCESSAGKDEKLMKSQSAAIADIEVTMVESHANLKIRSKRRPKQLLKVVSALHSMRLTVLHLNVSTADQIVLYCLSVKVEDDCKLSSVDEIATAVYQMLESQKEAYSQ
ncbi:MAX DIMERIZATION MAD [Salix koriyanagi]|uniref:MAX DIMERIZATION MAD n=1 Tax=Salix koriyanagi TaxID=2511006 RepID=A0A9Q0VZ30_9ROSI|nr:MAX DIMERIZATION MAD [Salix koriyanagi]